MASVTTAAAVDRDVVQFHEESFQSWEDLQDRFRERGPDGYYRPGIIAEELGPNPEGYRSILHIANPYEDLTVDEKGKVSGDLDTALTVVSFPSYATKEEIETIRDSVIPMPETCEMLLALAQAKELSNMILIEGDTSLGKTFSVNTFVKLLYGPTVKALDFYCNGQTDVSELHGMWVPKLMSETDRQRWETFLDSTDGASKLNEIVDSAGKGLEPEERRRVIIDELKGLARSIGLSGDTNWEFSAGSLPRAYQAIFDPETRRITGMGPGGRGFPLHFQDIGVAPARVINALLECGGEYGRMADTIQIWRNGGEVIHRGPDTLLIMTTNPVEGAGFQERNELDRALLRRSIPDAFGKGLSAFSTFLATGRYFTYQLGNRPERKPNGCVVELYNYPDDIGRALTQVVSAFHIEYVTALKAGEGRGATSLMVPSLDQLARLADYMLRFQVRDRKTGGVDLIKTLHRGVERIYLKGLKNDDKAEQLRQTLATQLDSEKLLSGPSGRERTPREVIVQAAAEACRNLPEESGYSPELIRAMRLARRERQHNASETIREGLVKSDRVPSAVKRLLGGWGGS